MALLALFLGCAAKRSTEDTARQNQKPTAVDGRAGFIRVSGKEFVFSDSGSKFTPWGFNYDHDRTNRLLEYYWDKEWDTVVKDFREMKALGANAVRIHLQVSRFMKSPEEVNPQSIERLTQLVRVAETTGLYLDITGLGCYDKPDVPKWYNDLEEVPRWDVQARFWETIARTCSNSPAVFCYDLMNEPVITEDEGNRDWTPGAWEDRYFVQRLTLNLAGRTQRQVAKAWVERLVPAIRKHDRRHLITVGVIPWSMVWPGAQSILYAPEISTNLDFVSVHFYPEKNEVEKALKALEVYDIGKPTVIEEMFPLSCSVEELDQFIDGSRSRHLASGWIGFYWGKTIAEYKASKGSLADAFILRWLEYFAKKRADILGPKPPSDAIGYP
jgi:hypothetical protein